jgi:hypothetical protein
MARRFASRAFLGLLALALSAGGCIDPTPTETGQPDAGLVVQGHVRLDAEGGAGLADVPIYRRYSAYPGVVIATTDRDGAYQSDFAPIPGDEMVTVWAELEGYTFEPEEYYWRHYYGRESRTLNFVAVPLRLPKSGRLRKSLSP